MKYILLSHAIDGDTPLYGNTPALNIKPHTRIASGDSSNTSILSIHNHSGTHVDAPKHFVDDGRSISDYSLCELVFKNPIVVDCPKDNASLIMPKDLQHASELLINSECLLLRTGFEKYRNEERYRTYNPGIAPETILWIRKEYKNIRCIGIDSISISSFQHREEGRSAHRASFMISKDLGKPLLLLEDLILDKLKVPRISTLIVLPWQIKDLDSAPCNVLVILDSGEKSSRTE